EIPEENLSKVPKEIIENLTQIIIPVINISLAQEESLVQSTARIGQSVRWSKTVSLEQEGMNISVDIPAKAQLIGVREIENAVEIEISVTKITLNISGELQTIERYEHQRERNTVQLSSFGGIFDKIAILLQNMFALTGYTTIDPDTTADNITVIIEEPVQEVIVDYYTEAPLATEEYTEFGKRIIISSNTHYENIVSFTDIPDVDEMNIKLYWIVNETRQEFNYTAYDLNKNGKVDYIEWITPHLSNETFEVSLNIINVYSYPYVQGNWTVDFNTTGTANLTITTFNGTQWSEANESYDLRFLEVRCGDAVMPYVWTNNSVFIENYSCASIGTEVSKVITAGVHNLAFTFGGITKYAYNAAGDFTTCPDITGNVTVSVDTVWSNASFTCDYITITNNAILTLNSTGAGNTTINITAYEINITSGSQISVGSTGYLANQGPGAPAASSATPDGGAGHGGMGGESTANIQGSIYDNMLYPLQMGSGGDNNNARGPVRAAGAVSFNVSGNLIVDGMINASAGKSTVGGSSGGSILINTTTLSGSGTINATGGGATTGTDGSGAGGMITVYSVTNSFTGKLSATGGVSASGTSSGAAGTIYTKTSSQSYGELTIEGNNVSEMDSTLLNATIGLPANLDNLTIANGSQVVLNSSSLTVNNTQFILDSGSSFFQRGKILFPRVQTVNISGNLLFTREYDFNQSSVWNLLPGANVSTEST
ncbi:MAG: hypothetical protein AAB893_02940, partial [Patescibacteria group bacterium]